MPTAAKAVRPPPVLVLSRNPRVLAAAQDAAARQRRPSTILGSQREALARLAAPGRAAHHMLVDAEAAANGHDDLLAAAWEARGLRSLLLVEGDSAGAPHGLPTVPADGGRLAAALGTPRPLAPPAALPDTALLARALDRREIGVRYQPMLRLSDQRPVMVEALARWEHHYPPFSPDHFLPAAALAGLMRQLAVAVVTRAVAELSPLRRALPVCLAVNMPLEVLLQHDLPQWLHAALRGSPLRAGDLFIELTEHEEIHDRRLLERALLRLRRAGHGVLLDDITVADPRTRLIELPFAAIKLDRSLVLALPHSAHARQLVRRIARRTRAHGQVLIAEGVSEPALLGMLADLGVDWAQGFLLGRPMPAAALPAWAAQWRARGHR